MRVQARYKRPWYCIGLLVLLSSCAQNTKTIEEFSGKNSEYYYNLGMASLTAGNYAKAIAEFKRAVLEDENNYRAYDKLAIAYINVNDYKKAIENIDRAISIKPDYYKAMLDKATILQTHNHTKEAIKTLNQCIKNDLCTLRPEAYYELAHIYKLQNNKKEYIKNLNLAVLYDRNFNVAKLDLAKVYIENSMCNNKNIEEKVMYLLNFQNTPDISLLKAKCLIEAKEFDKASKLIQRMLSQEDINEKYKKEAIAMLKDLIKLKHEDAFSNKNNINFANTHQDKISK